MNKKEALSMLLAELVIEKDTRQRRKIAMRLLFWIPMILK